MISFATKLRRAITFLETAGAAQQHLLQLASELGGAYPAIMQYMIDRNPHRIEAWVSTIKTPDDLEKKVDGWRKSGTIGSDQEFTDKARRDSSGKMRINAARNDPAAWFRMLDDPQKMELKFIARQGKAGHAIRAPQWLSRDEIPLFNQVIGAGWF